MIGRTSYFFTGLSLILMGLAIAQSTPADDENEKLASKNQAAILASIPPGGYPSAADIKADWRATMAFDSGVGAHAYPREKSDKRDILMITEFEGGNILREYSLSGRGEEQEITDMVDWSERGGQAKQLTRSELTLLHAAVAQLPPSTTLPTPYSKLCLVSFEEGAKWVSRWYNRDAYPPQLQQILDLLLEPPKHN